MLGVGVGFDTKVEIVVKELTKNPQTYQIVILVRLGRICQVTIGKLFSWSSSRV